MRLGRRDRCSSCRQPLHDDVVPEMRGAEADVEVLVRRFPVKRCPDGHEVRQRPEQHSLALVHSIDDSIPYVQRGRCPVCHSDDGERLARSTFDVVVESGSGESFDASVTAPAWRCRSCGSVALDADDRVHAQIGDALVGAFKAGGVRT